jgi:hypothetical protein
VSKGVYELVSDLQYQLALLVGMLERGKRGEDDRVSVDVPMEWIEESRAVLDASYGKEVATK